MSHLVQVTNAFHTAGAGLALTAAYVDGDIIQPARPANTMRLEATLAWGTAPTSVQIQAHWRTAATWVPVSAVNSVVAGTIDIDDGVWEPPVAAPGTHEIMVYIPAGADIRVRAKMVDAGASDPTLFVVATLTDD